MKKIKALVVDDNKEFTNNVLEYFKDSEVLEVAKVINKGNEVIDYLKNNEVDIMFLDFIMPEMDGIAILEEMAKEKISKKVIILTSFLEEYTMDMIKKYHVDYYMIKPINLGSLEKRALEIMERENTLKEASEVNNEIEIKTSELLHNLGVPSQIKGYQYLREGILMLYQNSNFIGGITKNLYPEIARKHDTTASRVERAIRHAIEVSWTRGDYQIMNKLFGHSIDYDRAKPTNSEFLVTVSDALRLNNKKIFSYQN